MGRQKNVPTQTPVKSVGSFIFSRQLPMETETTLFILVSVLDIFMTWILLMNGGFVESNPVANFFLMHWGKKGLVAFKLIAVFVVCLSTQLIALKRLGLARLVLNSGTIVVAFVVVYSFSLYLNQPPV